MQSTRLPLSGIRVLEFSHAVMGPTSGLILADLGAEVIKVEGYPDGDSTRRLSGFGSGFFTFFNRNKQSIALDLNTQQGKDVIYHMLPRIDVIIENYAPGSMESFGLGYKTLQPINPRLIYCGLKGFLTGPYENRMALDEVVQMMTGLAYMTGGKKSPTRAGASIIDILSGSFGVISVLAALHEREVTGKGQKVQVGLFETGAFLMGQHMTYAALHGTPIPSMSERVSSWGIYDLFTILNGELFFVGVTSNSQWERFCRVFDRPDLYADPRLRNNEDRVCSRAWMIPQIQETLAHLSKSELIKKCDLAQLPFAPVGTPEDLFSDPQMVEGHNLLRVSLPNGETCNLPTLPIEMRGQKASLRHQPPLFGEDTKSVLDEFGLELKLGKDSPTKDCQQNESLFGKEE